MNFDIVVKSTPEGNKYFIDGIQQPTLQLVRGDSYTFSQKNATNNTHPVAISTTPDGTHGGGIQYTDKWSYRGTAGSNGKGILKITDNTPSSLYYYCMNHAGMGGSIDVVNESEVSVESESRGRKFAKQAGLVGATLYLAYKLRKKE